MNKHTFANTRNAMEPTDNNESANIASEICSNTACHAGKKSFDLPFIPNRPFNCDEPIVRAAADVKPDTTGNDIKSTKNPTNKPYCVTSTVNAKDG